MAENSQPKPTRWQSAANGARRQGGTLGVSVSVILSWVLAEYAGITPPAEVVSAAAGLITGIGMYIQRNMVG